MNGAKPENLTIQPPLEDWCDMARQSPNGTLLGRSQSEWRALTRHELNLATDRLIIATGHQTLLWHPGILAKYIAMDAAARACGFATANLVVDQHVGDFDELDIPIRNADGSLSVLKHNLTKDTHSDVPMALHAPFTPAQAPPDTAYALDCVREGVERIVTTIDAHRDAPNAAIQMARALAELMQQWVAPAINVPATQLCKTSLANALIQHMQEKPHECIESYNRAVAAVPEAGVPPLLQSEVPLWRIEPSGMRARAHVSDLKGDIQLMPRALFMTALVRLGMCDLFIHGTGGAAYDHAMEFWIRDWLGVEVAPKVVVSADLHLPLLDGNTPDLDAEAAVHDVRHLWHDPTALNHGPPPSEAKRAMLKSVEQFPRNTPERKAAFLQMHAEIAKLRHQHQSVINAAQEAVAHATRCAGNANIATRRDWAFALYDDASIDALALAIRNRANEPAQRH